MLFLTFFARTVYEFCTLEGIWYLPDMPLTNERDLGPESALCFMAWDYVPIFLLVTTVTTATSGSFAARTGSFIRSLGRRGERGSGGEVSLHIMPNHGVWNEIKKGEQMRLIKQQQDEAEEEVGSGGNGQGELPLENVHVGHSNHWRAGQDPSHRWPLVRVVRSSAMMRDGSNGRSVTSVSSQGGGGSGASASAGVDISGGRCGVRGSSWGGFGRSPLSPGLLGGRTGCSSLRSSYGSAGKSRSNNGGHNNSAVRSDLAGGVVGVQDRAFADGGGLLEGGELKFSPNSGCVFVCPRVVFQCSFCAFLRFLWACLPLCGDLNTLQ